MGGTSGMYGGEDRVIEPFIREVWGNEYTLKA